MIYNTKKRKVKTATDCLDCPFWDKREKRCLGLNKICFEFDPITKTIIDGKTKLPRKI